MEVCLSSGLTVLFSETGGLVQFLRAEERLVNIFPDCGKNEDQ